MSHRHFFLALGIASSRALFASPVRLSGHFRSSFLLESDPKIAHVDNFFPKKQFPHPIRRFFYAIPLLSAPFLTPSKDAYRLLIFFLNLFFDFLVPYLASPFSLDYQPSRFESPGIWTFLTIFCGRVRTPSRFWPEGPVVGHSTSLVLDFPGLFCFLAPHGPLDPLFSWDPRRFRVLTKPESPLRLSRG